MTRIRCLGETGTVMQAVMLSFTSLCDSSIYICAQPGSYLYYILYERSTDSTIDKTPYSPIKNKVSWVGMFPKRISERVEQSQTGKCPSSLLQMKNASVAPKLGTRSNEPKDLETGMAEFMDQRAAPNSITLIGQQTKTHFHGRVKENLAQLDTLRGNNYSRHSLIRSHQLFTMFCGTVPVAQNIINYQASPIRQKNVFCYGVSLVHRNSFL